MPESVFLKITALLKARTTPIRFGKVGFAIWLARNLSAEEILALGAYGEQVGEDAANRRLTQALVDSGYYRTDDGVEVEAVRRPKNERPINPAFIPNSKPGPGR